MSIHSCAVCVTIFSTGGKFLEFYGVTHSYSSHWNFVYLGHWVTCSYSSHQNFVYLGHWVTCSYSSHRNFVYSGHWGVQGDWKVDLDRQELGCDWETKERNHQSCARTDTYTTTWSPCVGLGKRGVSGQYRFSLVPRPFPALHFCTLQSIKN